MWRTIGLLASRLSSAQMRALARAGPAGAIDAQRTMPSPGVLFGFARLIDPWSYEPRGRSRATKATLPLKYRDDGVDQGRLRIGLVPTIHRFGRAGSLSRFGNGFEKSMSFLFRCHSLDELDLLGAERFLDVASKSSGSS